MDQQLLDIRRTIARSIERARSSAQVTQEQLAELVGVNKTTVVRWEREDKPAAPGFDTAVLIARALGVSLDELAFGQREFFERVVEEVVRRTRQEPPDGTRPSPREPKR